MIPLAILLASESLYLFTLSGDTYLPDALGNPGAVGFIDPEDSDAYVLLFTSVQRCSKAVMYEMARDGVEDALKVNFIFIAGFKYHI